MIKKTYTWTTLVTCTSCTNFESQQSTHAYHMQQVLAVVVSLNDTPSLPKRENFRDFNWTFWSKSKHNLCIFKLIFVFDIYLIIPGYKSVIRIPISNVVELVDLCHFFNDVGHILRPSLWNSVKHKKLTVFL